MQYQLSGQINRSKWVTQARHLRDSIGHHSCLLHGVRHRLNCRSLHLLDVNPHPVTTRKVRHVQFSVLNRYCRCQTCSSAPSTISLDVSSESGIASRTMLWSARCCDVGTTCLDCNEALTSPQCTAAAFCFTFCRRASSNSNIAPDAYCLASSDIPCSASTSRSEASTRGCRRNGSLPASLSARF